MIFDYAAFILAFPELATRGTQAQVTALAARAAMFVPLSSYSDLAQQQQIWFLATAHLIDLTLPGGTGAQASANAQGLSGIVTSASEGSVSVSTDIGPITGPMQLWWARTPYGQQLWLLTLAKRRFRYVPGYPRRYPIFNPVP